VGCSANHQYDGLYIANKEITGVTKVWILEGNELTIYSMGVVNVQRCKQYSDRIEIKAGNAYTVDDKGDIIIASDSVGNVDYRMVKYSDRTNSKSA
jgi:hypothetical protein